MSPRSWGHGQTFVGGAIAGLALSYRPWLIFAAGVLVGAGVVLGARFGRRFVELVVELARRRRITTINGRARVRRG